VPKNVITTAGPVVIRRGLGILQRRGLRVLVRAAMARVRGLLASQAKSFQAHHHLFLGKSGLEIGGPSGVFGKGGIFPVYPIVGHLDNCNFSNTTAWDVGDGHGNSFRFDQTKQDGHQHIGEATSLDALASNSYDFVLSSHMLEHTANPIKALTEWKRILRSNGTMVLILPNKKHTFDHRRPVTTLDHLIADFKAETHEDDLTHLPEILALHDFQRDPDAGDKESFKLRAMQNVANRCLHHHVFDSQLATELVRRVGLTVHTVEEIAPHHIVLLAQKQS